MAGRNKGFDPLSSLFEAPEPQLGGDDGGAEPDAELPADATDAPGPKLEFTDPTFKSPPSVVAPPDVEPPAPAPAPPPAGPSDEEKRALAMTLAKAAAARAAAAAASAAPAPAPAPPRAKPKAPAKAPAASRLDSLASRARRPRSALEAARAAAAAEASRKKAAPAPAPAPARAPSPSPAPRTASRKQLAPAPAPAAPAPVADVSALLVGAFPRAQVAVIAVQPARQLPVLRSLWTAHRARFLSEGELVLATGAAAVLGALGHDGAQLAAAHLRVDQGEACVWVDAGQGRILAAFPEPATYLAGTG